MTEKVRVHNEWVMESARSRCVTCTAPEVPVIWGEYHNAKWRRVGEFCVRCHRDEFFARLADHTIPCGCRIVVRGRNNRSVPKWLRLACAMSLLEIV